MGKFHSEGQLGECVFKTAMGDIRLDQIGTLHANTAYGDITVNRVLSYADATTGSGEIRIREINGSALIKNSDGDTRIGGATGDLRIKAANGDIFIERAHTSVSAKTADGNVHIGDVVSGTIVLETASGELEVGIREGTTAWLDVSSQYGNVQNPLDDSAAPEQTEKTVEVRARTACGDIVIHRSCDDK